MELTFIGHQSWAISENNTYVLLDPLLLSAFGDFDNTKAIIYPPRDVDLGRMPSISAVIISHEHHDHFDIPSIDRLSRSIPFYLGDLVPSCVELAIQALGFTVHRVVPCKFFNIGDLDFALYPSASETVFWERRVYQVFTCPSGSYEKGVFIGVDALISNLFVEAVDRNLIPTPVAAIISNNSMIPPPGAVGSYSNLLPIDPAGGRTWVGFSGVSLLNDLLNEYMGSLPRVSNVIICGNGFLSISQPFGPYLFSDNQKLCKHANELSFDKVSYGPYPGDILKLDGNSISCSTADWIQINVAKKLELDAKQKSFLESPSIPNTIKPIFAPYANESEVGSAVRIVESELLHIGRSLLVSKMGELMISVNEYLNGSLGPNRFLFRFLVGSGADALQYSFNLRESRFVLDQTPAEIVLETFPFGCEVYLQDFVAVIEGKMAIWDLVGHSLRSWFLGSIYENAVAFLLIYFGEQSRPDLAMMIYKERISRLRANTLLISENDSHQY